MQAPSAFKRIGCSRTGVARASASPASRIMPRNAVRKGRRCVLVEAFAADLNVESYCAVGLAHCFEKNGDGKLVDRYVIEPISYSSLECMATGARTSFKMVTALRLGDAWGRAKAALPEEFTSAVFCDKWEARLEAAARTWSRQYAQDNLMDIVPLGVVRGGFNFNLEDKRVLNFENVVNDADNIKQDMSIDVYGRKTDEEEAGSAAAQAAVRRAAVAAPCEAAAALEDDEEDEEDALDALLAG